MMLWLVLALMTAAAIFAVLWPLAGARRCAPAATSRSIATSSMRSTATASAGLIGEREAEAARVEVSRRLLAAADTADSGGPRHGDGAPRRGRVRCADPAAAWRGRRSICARARPKLPGQPLRSGARSPPEQRSIVELVGQVEAHLEQNPEDGRGWDVLGPVYMRLGRYDDAVRARKNALRLLGATAEREADLGEALTGGANGVVTAEAKAGVRPRRGT